VTVNSDDPAYFGGYVGENLRAVRHALALDDATVIALARNSFRASFLDESTKRAYLSELDAYSGRARSGHSAGHATVEAPE
jgi:adenosine deaminase